MCRDILDSRPAAERLIDTGWVECELAEQVTVRVDHADASTIELARARARVSMAR
jgi:hypothetical protein